LQAIFKNPNSKHSHDLLIIENILQRALKLDRYLSNKKGHSRLIKAKDIEIVILKIRRKVLSEKYLDTFKSMTNLASIYGQQDRSKKAGKIGIKVLELRKKMLNKKYPDTLKNMTNLASIYRYQDRSKKAEKISVKILKLRKKMLNENHPDTLKSMTNLTSIYHQQGQLGKTEEIINFTSTYYYQQGYDYYLKGQLKKIKEIGIKLLKLGREIFSEKHSEILKIMAKLTLIYR
jgi:tetratricopeptide (TPR) repeat protein